MFWQCYILFFCWTVLSVFLLHNPVPATLVVDIGAEYGFYVIVNQRCVTDILNVHSSDVFEQKSSSVMQCGLLFPDCYKLISCRVSKPKLENLIKVLQYWNQVLIGWTKNSDICKHYFVFEFAFFTNAAFFTVFLQHIFSLSNSSLFYRSTRYVPLTHLPPAFTGLHA